MSRLNINSAEKALEYLAQTDVAIAKAKALMIGLDEQRKTIEAGEFLKSEGSAAERKQRALASESYRNHIEAYEDSVLTYETLRNRRLTATLQIEMWRSVNSARNKGQIV